MIMVNKPNNLDEAIAALKEMLSPKDFWDFKQGTEDQVSSWHHDLGRWIRNNWDLWKGGPLADHFKRFGIHHPDDMSGIILTSAHRQWNDKPIGLEAQIKYYQDYWKNNK